MHRSSFRFFLLNGLVFSLLSLSQVAWTTPLLASEKETQTSPQTPAKTQEETQGSPNSNALKMPLPKPRIKVVSYHDIRPQWGFQIDTSFNPFGGKFIGGNPIVPEQGTMPTYGFTLALEYQPTILQGLGVIGIGPHVGLYPIFSGGSVTPGLLSIYSMGAQIRYQARYFRKQFIVPMISYAFDYYSYKFSSGASDKFLATGPNVGVWILLNPLDPSSAAEFYIDNGVVRTYLVAEAHMPKSDKGISFSGNAYYFGLRFEF